MESKGPYRIDGVEYNHESLAEHCQKITKDPAKPEWYRKVFTFIGQFLDNTASPILQMTSGTTGDPGEHMLSREAMVASARKTISFFNLKPGDRALLCLPADYIAGKMMVVRALVGGMDLVLTEPSGRPLDRVSGEFNFAAMVPLQVHESLKEGDDLRQVETLLIGGGELHPSIRKKLIQMRPPAAYESFAMTETYTHFALRQINGPAPDARFRLLDGVTVNTDDRGCLVVNVPGITNGPVVTNDLVEIEPDGRNFHWLGRIDHVINTGGIKVIPELLEQRINGILGLESLILSQPDEKLGQKMVLMIEYQDSYPPIEKWAALLRERLVSHEIPKQIVPVLEIPRNASYKPDRVVALTLIT